MKNFNIKRFGHVLRWTYEHDRHEFVRSTLMGIQGLTVCMVFIQIGQIHSARTNMVGALALMIGFFVTIICTGSNMHYSMKTRDDWRTLSVLPASNMEKFLARYASSLLMMLGGFAALVVADVAQYLLMLIMNSKMTTLLGSYILQSNTFRMIAEDSIVDHLQFGCFVLMLHSCYLVGCNFFRNTKYGWVFTTLALIVLGIVVVTLIVKLMPEAPTSVTVGSGDWLITVLCLLFTAFNYWLAFRLFCRRQLIGKFINL